MIQTLFFHNYQIPLSLKFTNHRENSPKPIGLLRHFAPDKQLDYIHTNTARQAVLNIQMVTDIQHKWSPNNSKTRYHYERHLQRQWLRLLIHSRRHNNQRILTSIILTFPRTLDHQRSRHELRNAKPSRRPFDSRLRNNGRSESWRSSTESNDESISIMIHDYMYVHTFALRRRVEAAQPISKLK